MSKDAALTGHQQFAKNVVVSWSMHFIVLVAGFVIPRQINDNLSQEALGVWDLGWGLVRYLTLASLGVAPSLNRYTAMYRASGDYAALNRSVVAVLAWQLAIAVLVAVIVLATGSSLGAWVKIDDPEMLSDAQYVFVLLGLAVSVKMIGGVAGGILAGCHRWDTQHTINAMQDFFLAVFMCSALALGGGLLHLGAIVLLSGIATAVIRWRYAFKACPELALDLRQWNPKTARKMLSFGGKSVIFDLQKVIAFQTVVFALAATTGPAMVAVFNRGVALNRQIETIIRKFTSLFLSMASGLIGLERSDEAKRMILSAARYGMAVTLPFMTVLLCFGDFILQIWMGDGYANWTMLALISAGVIWPVSQSGAVGVVKGFNAHGKLALASLAVMVVAMTISVIVASQIGWNETVAGGVVAFVFFTSRGVVVPVFLKLRFDVPIVTYLSELIVRPLLCAAPLLAGGYFARQAILVSDWAQALIVFSCGGIALLVCYWFWIFDDGIRGFFVDKAQKLPILKSLV